MQIPILKKNWLHLGFFGFGIKVDETNSFIFINKTYSSSSNKSEQYHNAKYIVHWWINLIDKKWMLLESIFFMMMTIKPLPMKKNTSKNNNK